MVLIKYIGDVSPCRIRHGNGASRWSTGDINDMSDYDASFLLQNKNFVSASGKPAKEKEKKEESEVNLDLDGDGDVDKDDASIAGKVLYNYRKNK